MKKVINKNKLNELTLKDEADEPAEVNNSFNIFVFHLQSSCWLSVFSKNAAFTYILMVFTVA